MLIEEIASNLINIAKSIELILQNLESTQLYIISFYKLDNVPLKVLLDYISGYEIVKNLAYGVEILRELRNIASISINSFMYKVSSYDNDLCIILEFLEHVSIHQSLLSVADSVQKLHNIVMLCQQTLNLMASLYGYKELYKVVPLYTASRYCTAIYRLEERKDLLYILRIPYTPSDVRDIYILLLHELGHLFRHHNGSSLLTTIEKAIELVNNLRGKELDPDEIRMYRKWLKELFADSFALSIAGKNYVDVFWRQYGHLVPNIEYARDSIEHPPLTLRFKLMEKMLEFMHKKELEYMKYVNEVIKQHSNKLLSGYLEYNQLEEWLHHLSNEFYKVIIDNSYREFPYYIVLNYGNEYKLLYDVIIKGH